MYLDITLTAKNWHRAHPLQDRALSEHQWSACDAERACVDVLVVHSAFQRSRPRHPGESDRLDRSSRSGLPTFVRSSGLLRRRCDQAGWRARHQTFNACHRFAKASPLRVAIDVGDRGWRTQWPMRDGGTHSMEGSTRTTKTWSRRMSPLVFPRQNHRMGVCSGTLGRMDIRS